MQAPVLNPQSAAPRCHYPWTPDQGDGTYRNPILCADYSDPDVVRYGEDFWMTASSFNCTPGLPILHSRDLVNWSLVNHALENVPGQRYNEVQHGCGVWAPAIRVHAGKFWIFFPTPDEGIYLTTAGDPRGRWSDPRLVQAGKGLIDPSPLWDDDGQAYLVHAYAKSRAGIRDRLRVCPMAPDGTRLLGEGQIVFHQPDRHPTIEGPKFLKRDGWYYILAPAGGVPTGWQTVLRSRTIFGPYEDRIVLEQGGTPINGPHQGGLVDTPNGQWWFLHFQDAGVYGRIVHLQPVEWHDGWPLMGNRRNGQIAGEPVAHHPKPGLPTARMTTPATGDEFNSSRLGLQWQWHANHQAGWFSLSARPGWLRLFAQPLPANDPALAPHLLLQKFPAREFAVDTMISLSPDAADGAGGLVVMGNNHAVMALRLRGSVQELVLMENGRDLQSWPVPAKAVRLRVQVAEGGECSFAFADEHGAWTVLEHRFRATPGVWIGAKVGLIAWRPPDAHGAGWADFDYFRFSGSAAPQ
jgi:beta-xylosidase